ncbi:MAG: hypothetical protein DWH70_09655 [Planctomycetota bacterium]|nr:MAG: hypothetical protein DWH70_09655 [Planctomycetota bacterium]
MRTSLLPSFSAKAGNPEIQAAKRLDLRIPEGDKGAGLRREGRQEDLVIAAALAVLKAAC